MSVRRLAEPAVQPASFAFTEANEAAAAQWVRKYPEGRQQSAIIPLLMIAQDQEGWVSKAAIEQVANRLDMPFIRALEVATFYTQYQLKPVGTKAHIQVCGTTPCMLRGSEALMDVCRAKIHHDQFHPNDSGTLSWEEVECLGACVNAPMVMIFKDTFEDLTPERFAEIIDLFDGGRGQEVLPGPQNGRIFAAPEAGLTTLQDEAALLKSTRDRNTAAAAQSADAATVPPSNAAKPKTDAAETNPTIKTPSATTIAPATETSPSAPPFSAARANMTSPEVEGVAKQRRSRSVKAEIKEPGAPLIDVPESLVQPVKSVAKPSLYDPGRPKGIDKPEKPDDLRLVSGIGTKNESILNSLGIFTFAQIAAWTKAERDWVDAYLNFRGRIDRDDWVRQADALARGGVTEYVRVFGKKPE